MTQTVACPACAGKLRLPDDLAGRDVRCPRCDATFAAPALPPPGPEPAAPDLPLERAPDPPPPPGPVGAVELRLSLDDDPPRPPAAPRAGPPPERPGRVPPPPRLNDEHDDLQTCPGCGRHAHRDATRCPSCGGRLGADDPDPDWRPLRRRVAEPHRGGTVAGAGHRGTVPDGVPGGGGGTRPGRVGAGSGGSAQATQRSDGPGGGRPDPGGLGVRHHRHGPERPADADLLRVLPDRRPSPPGPSARRGSRPPSTSGNPADRRPGGRVVDSLRESMRHPRAGRPAAGATRLAERVGHTEDDSRSGSATLRQRSATARTSGGGGGEVRGDAAREGAARGRYFSTSTTSTPSSLPLACTPRTAASSSSRRLRNSSSDSPSRGRRRRRCRPCCRRSRRSSGRARLPGPTTCGRTPSPWTLRGPAPAA